MWIILSAYRERKDAYVKALEAELLRLRSREAAFVQETQKLYAEISSLRKLVANHGIDLPNTPTVPAKNFDSFSFTVKDFCGRRKITTLSGTDRPANELQDRSTPDPSKGPALLDQTDFPVPESRQDPNYLTRKRLPRKRIRQFGEVC